MGFAGQPRHPHHCIYGIDFRVTKDAENQDWIGKCIVEEKMLVDDKSVLVR